MSQPVVDTLQLSDAFRKTGMEPEQAEGMARALGEELGEHVAVKGDLQLQSGFRQVRSDLRAEIQQVRSDLGVEIQQVRAEVQQVRSDLGAEIQQVRAEVQQVRSDLGAEVRQVRCDLEAKIQAVDNKVDGLNWKLTFLVGGFGLLLTVLTVVSGMGFFDRPPAAAHPVSENRRL